MIDDSLSRRIIIYASISGALGILAGTFGAHMLPMLCQWQGYTDLERRTDLFTIGVRYHLVHAVALLALSAMPFGSPASRQWVSRMFLVGLFLFSGSLYALAVSNATELRFVPPFGGLAWIAGWLLLLVVAKRSSATAAVEKD